jgi:hypothetical protein
MFQPFGTAPYLHWLSLRLRQRGLLLPADETAPDWLPTGWQGYTADNCWLDLGDDDSSALNLRLLHCQQQQVIAVEICGQWQPQGEQLGFMLLCGSALPLPANASRWLDNMAPIPGAWLHCGPAGSARYTLHVMNAMQYAWKLAWQHLPASATPSAINWEQCMQQQMAVADKLLSLSLRYLQQQGIDAAGHDAETVRTQFSLPPGQQTHFAANLALLIVLAMQQRDTLHSTLQQIFSTLQPQPTSCSQHPSP